MRKHRRNLLLALFAALALVGGRAWLSLRPREPVYQGKSLSECFSLDVDGGLESGTEEAIRHIGTNSIPILLQMLRAHDSKFKLQLIRLAEKQHLVKFRFVSAADRNREAALAFHVLGGVASNAVPDLIHVFDEKVSDSSQSSAIDSLSNIGPAARPTVTELLVRTVGNTNADADLRDDAMGALIELQADSGFVVPIFVKRLKDPDSLVRFNAAEVLGFLGGAAKAAVPVLVDVLKDPDPNLRVQAEQALKAIDPEAAAKAGVP